jgi:hypothetical protein
VADGERPLTLGRGELGEPLVGAADRVEGEDVVEEALPGRPDRLPRLARRQRRSAGAVRREEVGARVDVGNDVPQAGPVDLHRGRVAGEACRASGRIERGGRRARRARGEATEGQAQAERDAPGAAMAGHHARRFRHLVARRVDEDAGRGRGDALVPSASCPLTPWRTASHAASTRSRAVRGSRPRRRAVSL